MLDTRWVPKPWEGLEIILSPGKPAGREEKLPTL